MSLTSLHYKHKETQLSGRYIPYSHIEKLMKKYASVFQKETLGSSVLGAPISYIKLGAGSKKVLAWSQMHGNESTTTKALFDFLSFISSSNLSAEVQNTFFETYTLYLIPMLNPDGAAAYTRVNANKIDLNRDAQDLSQPESKLLRQLFNEIQPDLCLNLHDQRSIFGLSNGNPANVSFLAPAGDVERTVLPARKEAMQYIEKMNATLQTVIPNSVGRYDDAFNPNCVGDTFTMEGVPTILFEAGHIEQDYQREETRSYIFIALLSLFDLIPVSKKSMNYEDIPENKKNYCDVLLKGVRLDLREPVQNIAIQFQEVLEGGSIFFKPSILETHTSLLGHRIIECKGELLEFDGLISVKKGMVFDKVCISSNKRLIPLNI